MRIKNLKKGSSAVEVTAVIILILAIMVGFGGYIKRGMAGRWKAVGDTFGQGRQYDPRGFGVNGEIGGTLDCFYDSASGHWVDEKCYQANNCDCTLIRGDGAALPEYQDRCVVCKANCQNDVLCQ